MSKTPAILAATLFLAACAQPQGVGFTYGPGPDDSVRTNASVRTAVNLRGYEPAPRHAAQSREMRQTGSSTDIASAARLAIDVAPVSSGSGNLEVSVAGNPYFVRQVRIDTFDFAVLEPGSGSRASAQEAVQAAAIYTGCLATGQNWTFSGKSVSALDCS